MGKKGFGSKRRTVLQLDDGPRRQPTYGLGYKASDNPPVADGSSNALSGLMSHYAQDSGSDSDSDNEASPAAAANFESSGTSHTSKPGHGHLPFQKFVAATDKSLQGGMNQPDSSERVPVQSEVKTSETAKTTTDEIDLKLQDFLAEIESIETKTEDAADDGIDGVPLANAPTTTTQQLASATAPSGSAAPSDDDDDDFKLSKPKEPVTKWHQCLDEETQCYYYWHIDSNEVTWEIPAEYSQYLLQYAEYERALAHYDSELAEWKKAHPKRKPKKKKHRKHAKKAEDVCIPIVSYPPEEDEPVVEGPVQGPACGPPLSMIGPSLMENKQAETLKSSCGDPSESEVASSAAQASTSVVSSTSEMSCVVSEDVKSTAASSTDERGENDVHKLKAVHEKYVKRSSKSRNSAADQLTNGKTSPVVTNADNNKSAAVVGDTVAADDDGEYDEDDEFALKMLEEPVFLRYEFVNKKYDVAQEPDVPDMDVDLGPDDIDKELERALEQKTSTDFESGIGKRKADDDVSSNAVAKKIKTNLESATSIALLQQPVKDDVRRRVDELSEVADLASTVMDKLEFLEVSCASLSKLQVLLLQIETRIEDWRAGALRTDRLLTKLRESCATLRQYEMSATPPGWSCHWHRSYKRYYYRHDVTDQIRWDYPDVEVAVEPEKIQSSDRLDFVDTYPTENSTNACENLPSVEISSSVTIPSSAHVSYAGGSGGGNVPTVSVDSSAAFYPADDPPPPGTEPALPVRLPSDLLSSLAACPPPPPPVTPPDASVVNMEDGSNVELEDVAGQINSSTLQSSLIHGLEDTNEVVISALPIRNKLAATEVTSSTYSLNTPVLSPAAEGDSEGPGSPFKDTADAGMIDGVPMGDVISSHSVSSQPGKERKKKKDKALVSGGLALKKKNVSSLVEKWQKVQQDVTDEITKEEQKLKMKKLAASTSSSHD